MHRDHIHRLGTNKEVRAARMKLSDIRGYVCMHCNSGNRRLFDLLSQLFPRGFDRYITSIRSLQERNIVDLHVQEYQGRFRQACYKILRVSRPDYDWRWLTLNRPDDWKQHIQEIRKMVSLTRSFNLTEAEAC